MFLLLLVSTLLFWQRKLNSEKVSKGGVVDTIHNNVTGYLVENNDNMEEFTTKVKHLIDNPKTRQYFAKNAVCWAEQWTWLKSAEQVQNYYISTVFNCKRKLQQRLEKYDILNTILYDNDF